MPTDIILSFERHGRLLKPSIEVAKELATALKAQGLCTSLKPNKAVEQATEKRLTMKQSVTHGTYITKLNNSRSRPNNSISKSNRVSVKDIPILALACKLLGKQDYMYARSIDGLLLQEYQLHADGTWTLIACRPSSDIIDDLCKLPVEVLLPLHGVHPSLDAYINWRLTRPQGATLP